MDPTPRGSNEPWRFTPSMLDPNSFAFANFANQPPGYYTPTPGGTNTLYHPQAGDLHTPGFTLGGLGTPLSLPTSEGAINAAQSSNAPMHGFHSQTLAPQVFQNPNPFGFHPHQPQHVQTFPPHHFSHPSAFDAYGHSNEPPKPEEPIRHDVEMQGASPTAPYVPQTFDTTMQSAPLQQRIDQ
jgi:hypothetical protein